LNNKLPVTNETLYNLESGSSYSYSASTSSTSSFRFS